MTPGVRAALAAVFRAKTGAGEADAWLAGLRASGRYLEDIWGETAVRLMHPVRSFRPTPIHRLGLAGRRHHGIACRAQTSRRVGRDRRDSEGPSTHWRTVSS